MQAFGGRARQLGPREASSKKGSAQRLPSPPDCTAYRSRVARVAAAAADGGTPATIVPPQTVRHHRKRNQARAQPQKPQSNVGKCMTKPLYGQKGPIPASLVCCINTQEPGDQLLEHENAAAGTYRPMAMMALTLRPACKHTCMSAFRTRSSCTTSSPLKRHNLFYFHLIITAAHLHSYKLLTHLEHCSVLAQKRLHRFLTQSIVRQWVMLWVGSGKEGAPRQLCGKPSSHTRQAGYVATPLLLATHW